MSWLFEVNQDKEIVLKEIAIAEANNEKIDCFCPDDSLDVVFPCNICVFYENGMDWCEGHCILYGN